MKNKLYILLTIVGSCLTIGGIFIEFADPKVISTAFNRPDLVSIAIIFGGVLIGLMGITGIVDGKLKTKLKQIEEKDERNVKLNQYAKSKAFDFMSSLFGLGLLILALLGYMNKVSFSSLAGFYLIVHIYYLYQHSVIKKLI